MSGVELFPIVTLTDFESDEPGPPEPDALLLLQAARPSTATAARPTTTARRGRRGARLVLLSRSFMALATPSRHN
jgi:hypothetical protein